jgi:hypothetical protein
MNKFELRISFLSWIRKYSSVEIPDDDYLFAALDAAVQLTLNSMVNNTPIIEVLSFELLCHHILQSWKSHALSPLSINWKDNVRLRMYGAEVPTNDFDYQQKLQKLFSQLENECLL